MNWMDDYIEWNRLRLFPMASYPFGEGEISFLEQGLINRLYYETGHVSVDVDLSTRLDCVFLGLSAAFESDYFRYFEEKRLQLEGEDKDSHLPEPMVICTKDQGMGWRLYRQLAKRNVEVIFFGQDHTTPLKMKEDLKKKKLIKTFEEQFKKIHSLREDLEEEGIRRNQRLNLESQIEDWVEKTKKGELDLKNLSEEKQNLEETLAHTLSKIEGLQKQVKKRGIFLRWIPNRELLEKERTLNEELFRHRQIQKEIELSLKNIEDQMNSLTLMLKQGEESEKSLRKELSHLKKKNTKKEKYKSRLEYEKEYKKELPLLGTSYLEERSFLYLTSQKMKYLLCEEVDLSQKDKGNAFASVIIVSQEDLEDFVKQCLQKNFQRIFLYGGDQIRLEDHWTSLSHFRQWISFSWNYSQKVSKNVHQMIMKDHPFLVFYKGEGSYLYSKFCSDVLYLVKDQENHAYFESDFIKGKNGVWILDVKSKSLREGLWLQPSHSKVLQEFLRKKLDEQGEGFFSSDFKLLIIVPSPEIKEAVISDIRRNLFSHSVIRDIRQKMIVEEGLSGEALDILKTWCRLHVLSVKEGECVDLSDKQILWMMGGSFDTRVEEDTYLELLMRTILDSKCVGIISEQAQYLEHMKMYTIMEKQNNEENNNN